MDHGLGFKGFGVYGLGVGHWSLAGSGASSQGGGGTFQEVYGLGSPCMTCFLAIGLVEE